MDKERKKIIRNLIKAFTEFAWYFGWDGQDYINTLINTFGYTRKDFRELGVLEYVEKYLREKGENHVI